MAVKILRHCCANCCNYEMCIKDESTFEFNRLLHNNCVDFGIDGEITIEDLIFDEEDLETIGDDAQA